MQKNVHRALRALVLKFSSVSVSLAMFGGRTLGVDHMGKSHCVICEGAAKFATQREKQNFHF